MIKVVILHNQIENNTIDELDVLAQQDLVMNACINLGYETTTMTIGDDLKNDLIRVKSSAPDIVFNLTEATWGYGELIYMAPAVLNAFKIPYTGVPLDALFITTNKVLAKELMLREGLPTAPFFKIKETSLLDPLKKYIVKPIWEEASVGILEDLIFTPSETEKMMKIQSLSDSHFFIEEFIDGREINISMLAGPDGPEILPPAEIIFSDYFKDKPKIVGYKAKWDEDSEEYKQTNREFGTLEDNPTIKASLHEICMNCWKVFNLHGYIRIDVRLDNGGDPYILEINGNPCISPDSGFMAAADRACYSRETVVERILKDAN
jgi:D-alanine-D-alanine ligase